MDRYYSDDDLTNKRSSKNVTLYSKIYDEDSKYSNIEGIASIEKTNEIDITKIKEMLKNREDYQKERDVRQIVKPSREQKYDYEFNLNDDKEEEKNYDIRDILAKARVEHKDVNKDYHSLNNTQYNILKSIDVDKDIDAKEYFKDLDKEENLEELINTITNTSMLNKMDQQELALSMFEDFKTRSHNLSDSKSIQAIMDEEYRKEKTEDLTDTMDKSFYTAGMKFSKEDFGDDDVPKKKSILSHILTLLIFLIIIAFTVLVCYFLFK